MLVERRRSAFPTGFLIRVLAAWVLVCALLIAVQWKAIATGLFPGPDDVMRLVQVRDLLGGQGWFDITQHRVDSANGGVAMHWSRLIDIPLLIVIGGLTPFVGAPVAESAALIIVPLITLLCAMLLAARIAWRLMGDEEATITALIIAVCVPVLAQFSPMRIDHHAWQIVCALAAMNGLMARSPVTGGWVVGLSLAVWLAISIEGLPLAAAIFAVLAYRWWRDRADRDWLVAAIQSLAVSSAAIFLTTRGWSDLAAHCDAINPVHLAMFAWGAIVLSILGRVEPVPRFMLLAGFGIAGGGALGLLLYTAPQCATGGFSALDPIVAKYWHANVLEGMPIWRQKLTNALLYALTPLVGLYATIRLVGSSRDWLRRFWFDYALILAAAFLVSLLVARAGAVACILAMPPLAWQVRQWLRRIRNLDRPAARIAGMVGVAFALLPALPVMLLSSAFPAKAAFDSAQVSDSDSPLGNTPSLKASECKVVDAAEQLATLPKGEFFTPMDIAPDLLLSTDHSVIATGHHRGNDGMKTLIETAQGSVEDAHSTLIARRTDYVLTCPTLAELRNYGRRAPDGFAAMLLEGEAPEWLQPLPLESEGGLKLWRVVSE